MGRYLRTGQCLDCLAQLSDPTVCGACGLPQAGPAADHLRWVLGEADVTLAHLRDAQGAPVSAWEPGAPMGAAQLPYPSPSIAPAGSPTGPGGPDPWLPPPPVPAPRRRTLPALSTPVVLLGLGALCLLVAAIVFVSVAWSDLSLATRTLLLVGVTFLIGVAALATVRRGLRVSAETLSTLFTLLVALDVEAAHSGGLAGAGSLSQLHADALTAATLTALGAACGLLGLRSRLSLTGVQWAASLGLAWLAALGLDHLPGRVEYAGFIVAVVLVGVAYGAARVSLWRVAVNSLVIAVIALGVATLTSLGRVLEADTLRGLWGSGEAVGWLICCALAGLAVHLLPRVGIASAAAATAATSGITLLALRPLQGAQLDVIIAALSATSALLAFAFLVKGSRPWHIGAGLTSALTGCLAAGLLLPSLVTAAARAVTPSLHRWQLSPTHRVHVNEFLFVDSLTSLTVGTASAVLASAAWVLLTRRFPPAPTGAVLVATALAIAVLQHPLSLYAVVATLAALTAVSGAAALRSHNPLAGWASVVSMLVLLAASLGSAQTTLIVTAAVAIGLTAVAARPDVPARRTVAAGGAVGFAGCAVAAGLHLADVSAGRTGVALTGIGAVVVLAAQLSILTRARGLRPGLEVSALVVMAAGVGLAARADYALLLPVALTTAGASLAATALLSSDRRTAAVPGALLLAAASWVRLASQDVSLVEAYTLPSALALCAVGLRAMRRTADASSAATMAPGLSLALLPSLLRTLPEPTSLRALLLGAAAVTVLLGGARLRWLAPLLLGGAVATVLGLINLSPYAAALPRWVLFATVGAGLLVLGVTWERRLRNARNLTLALQRLR